MRDGNIHIDIDTYLHQIYLTLLQRMVVLLIERISSSLTIFSNIE